MEQTTYQVSRLADGCHAIEENGVRSYVIAGDKRAVLLDTGFGTGELLPVVEEITRLPVQLVNTHADPDHIGCNARFGAAWMHPAEYAYYRLRAGEVRPVHPLWEDDVLDLGGRLLEVVHIPGHTPGSITLLDEGSRVLYSGDSVQTRNIFMFGPGRSMPAYIASMEKLMERYLHRFDNVFPAHGPVPVEAEIIPRLRDGAAAVLAGEVEGKPGRFMNVAAVVYDVGVARFLCDE